MPILPENIYNICLKTPKIFVHKRCEMYFILGNYAIKLIRVAKRNMQMHGNP